MANRSARWAQSFEAVQETRATEDAATRCDCQESERIATRETPALKNAATWSVCQESNCTAMLETRAVKSTLTQVLAKSATQL